MQSTGYIYFYRDQLEVGRIRACSGTFTNLNIPFSREDCDEPLRKKLKGSNINKEQKCPPPDGVLRVSFRLDIQDGDLAAVDVRED